MTEARPRLQLGKIMLKNYKTYKGDVTIELSRDLQKTITIIHGAMGHGKTTLLDAIYWCLYGENRSTDIESDEGIINSKVLDSINVNEHDETMVEIHLYEEDELRYKIKRVMEFIKKQESSELTSNLSIGGRVHRGILLNETSSFSHLPPNSDWIPYSDPDRVKSAIDNIFPKSLSKYFLFDAELLDNFFDISDEKNAKVKDGIEKISGLPILDTAIKHLTKTSNSISKTMKDVSLEPLQDEVSLCERKRDANKKIIEDEGKKIEGITRKIDTIESFLLTHNEETIKNTQAHINELNLALSENKDLLKKHNHGMNNRVLRHNTIIRLRDSIKKSMVKCDTWEKDGKIPIAVSGLALKNILNGNPPKCICGASLNEGSAERDHIEELLKENPIDSPIIQNITIGRQHWDNMWDEIQVIEDTLKKDRTRRDELYTSGRDKYDQKKVLEKKYENVNVEEIKTAFQRKKDLQNDERSAIEKRTRAVMDHENAVRQLEIKGRELKIEIKKYSKNNSQTNRMTLADTLEKIFKNYRDEMVDELRDKVAEKTTQYFLKLVSRKDDFSKVHIKKNYKVLALDNNQKNKSLSAGQSCCLALSYIAAIREIAEKNYFMLIDSPLHNISQEERVDIAKNLPKFLPQTQITLLVQDQEYTGHANKGITGEEIPSVRKTLMENNSIWREYVLHTEKGESNTSYTTIQQVDA